MKSALLILALASFSPAVVTAANVSTYPCSAVLYVGAASNNPIPCTICGFTVHEELPGCCAPCLGGWLELGWREGQGASKPAWVDDLCQAYRCHSPVKVVVRGTCGGQTWTCTGQDLAGCVESSAGAPGVKAYVLTFGELEPACTGSWQGAGQTNFRCTYGWNDGGCAQPRGSFGFDRYSLVSWAYVDTRGKEHDGTCQATCAFGGDMWGSRVLREEALNSCCGQRWWFPLKGAFEGIGSSPVGTFEECRLSWVELQWSARGAQAVYNFDYPSGAWH